VPGAYAFLTLLCALIFLPGITTLPPTDRDESRFMQATKQMVESGDYIHIHFQNEARNKKPVGIYWLQAAAVKLTGVDNLAQAWPYRIPSALTAWLAVLIVFAAARRLWGTEAGMIAGAVLATSLMTIVEAHIAKTDAALLAATTLALTSLGAVYVNGRGVKTLTALLFWVALGVGVLIKGPAIVLVVGATVAALCIADRDWKWTLAARPVYGIPLALIVVLPWFLAVSSNTEASFITDAVRGDILPKLLGGQEGHGQLPGTYLLSAFATLWPWSLLAPFVVVIAWRARAEPAVRFCLAWLIPGWIVFELIPTKLPHYTLPLFPAFALLAAKALIDAEPLRRLMTHRAGIAYRVVWGAATLALGVGVVYFGRQFGDGNVVGISLAAIVFVAAAILGLTRFSTARGLTACGAALALVLTLALAPHLPALTLSARIAAVAKTRDHDRVVFAGFHEPSSVFLLGTKTRLTTMRAAADELIGHPQTLGVFTADEFPAAQDVLAAAGRKAIELARLSGYEYSRGRWVDVVLIATEDAQ
jgi:4-amino-4-deoxy-L-arabinose transferase-like glycosyltransferase